MLTEEKLTKFLSNAYHTWGYAAGTEKIPGYLPGAKTFPFYQEETLTLSDTYFGKRESGGTLVVLENNSPVLLVQYHGGEPWTYVNDDQVQEINDFLKRALVVSNARLPGSEQPRLLYEEDKYAYVGFGRGNIWNLRWIEIIVQKNNGVLPEGVLGKLHDQDFVNRIEFDQNSVLTDWLVFYHIINHQRLR